MEENFSVGTSLIRLQHYYCHMCMTRSVGETQSGASDMDERGTALNPKGGVPEQKLGHGHVNILRK
jgi:hypothetical protein